MSGTPLAARSVGCVTRDDERVQQGYMLLSSARETYLIDNDGRVVHEWTSKRAVFSAYLLPNGNLLRDGSENEIAVAFQAGGAAGFVEEVTWDNKVVWSFAALPYHMFLTHHDLEPLPNGNVLIMCWERKSKDECIRAGRRPDLIPDGEVWDNVILELKPNGCGGADIVWRWCFWDHLVQDFDKTKANFGNVCESVHKFDINYCPAGGKNACRNQSLLFADCETRSKDGRATSGLVVYEDKAVGLTGEKDWLHCNSVSYDSVHDQILINVHIAAEIIIIQHGGYGDVLYRWGNPATYRRGSRFDQLLFSAHYAHFIKDAPGAGNVLLFNNGRAPDRQWSTVDEYVLPRNVSNTSEFVLHSDRTTFQPEGAVWSYGSRIGRRDSFYCTHISSAQRLPNGNTLVTMGPQGIVFEVTGEGEEVWRYINPVCNDGNMKSVTRQGDTRVGGRFSLFFAKKYPVSYLAFKDKVLTPGRHLEG